ncbi:dihydrolipoamide acetyltransferase family protein [Daejeonella oryzae]|uniref:dihydrolipoamide acetyltransferase family protein n=1 Tax=Daejeonella oryzae TaxID=1122943 RepID=UPI0004036A05|nr:dihydrolipoamide acetyltransferase family protein [Daejeonella oryzae]
MAQYELLLPKMGESVAEATIIKWVKQPGDMIEVDESVLEIATDKVDSEVPSPTAGKLLKVLFNEDDVVQVGAVIAIIETDANAATKADEIAVPADKEKQTAVKEEKIPGSEQLEIAAENKPKPADYSDSSRFYSPLVKSIAAEEGISLSELDTIKGSGSEGRVTKQDILEFVSQKSGNTKTASVPDSPISQKAPAVPVEKPQATAPAAVVSVSGGDEIIEMDRMRKLIADHMVMSKQTSPHVTSFVEADVTNIVKWRERVKNNFEKREGEKITFTPIFIEALAKAIKDLPMINVSVNGTQIIKKKDINIGMAAALPSGNLIVPVIKNADQLNLVGLTKSVNDLARRARQSKLKPDETQGGTFTMTNVGSFGNVMGTPIINQPQAAILAVGAIKKKPAVIETEYGDVIAIRHMMFLSLSYDHRVVDGSLGGSFVRKVADYLEAWDVNREI